MTGREVFGVRHEAMPAWLSLAHALDRMASDRRRPLCEGNPEQWGGDAPASARQEAAEACSWCPVLGPCSRFAEANNERQGVWAGIDRGSRPKTRRRAAA